MSRASSKRRVATSSFARERSGSARIREESRKRSASDESWRDGSRVWHAMHTSTASCTRRWVVSMRPHSMLRRIHIA